MVIFLQYTFTDLRAFEPRRSALLLKPSWPSPVPFREFFRGTGQIVERDGLGLANWIGENFVCKITRSIRFTQHERGNIRIKNLGKHFFASRENVLSKYEFAFAVRSAPGQRKTASLREIIKALFSMRVECRGEAGYTDLRTLHRTLKTVYLRNTSKRPLTQPQEDLIQSCVPQLYFFLDKDDQLDNNDLRINQGINGKNKHLYDLRGGWFSADNMPFRIWAHKRTSAGALVNLNRRLRISILRLHSEYSCINNVLNAIRDKKVDISPLSDGSQKLQSYLKTARDTILQDTQDLNGTLSVTNFLDYFKEKFDELQPGQAVELKQRIAELNIRPQFEKQIVTYIEKQTVMNTNITHSQGIAVGENAKVEGNSFSQVNEALPANIDREALLKELNELKAHLLKEASSGEQYEAVANVAKAEDAVKANNGSKVIEYLKLGGKWVVDTATKIGVSVVSEFLKAHLPQ